MRFFPESGLLSRLLSILLSVPLFILLAVQDAAAQQVQITQPGPHNTTTLRAVKREGRYIGFDLLTEDRPVVPVRFSSGELITCATATAKTQGGVSTLIFTGLTALPESGVQLGPSRVEITLAPQRFPVVAFDLHLTGFDLVKWQSVLGKQPFHFLTLAMPEATVWHHRGWLNATPKADPFPLLQDVHRGTPELAAFPYNRQWSTTPPLAAHPVPVIGLWAPARRLYAAWDFQATRLTDNSEQMLATGFCNRLIVPATSPAVVRQEDRGAPVPSGAPSAGAEVSEADREGGSKFVALVYPYGGQGYQQLVYPQGEVHLASHATLVYSTDLGDTDDPNRFLWQQWWNDPDLRSRLPRVPAFLDLAWIPDESHLKTLPGAPGGRLIAGVEASFQVPGTQLISGWNRHNESAVLAPFRRGDKTRIAALEQEAATLLKVAKRFKAEGETCVYWQKPLVGQWTDAWGGAPVTTLHNANGWAAGRLLLDLYKADGRKQVLPLVDGVLNWTKHIVWTRNEFADVPSSPFAIGSTLATAFLLDYYTTFIKDLERHGRAVQALDLARTFTYRTLVMWTADSNRLDSLDSAFLWEPNSGRDWTGAACANEVIWNLDTLAQTAVTTGDPILMWALQGSLSRWPLLYQDVVRPPPGTSHYLSHDFTEGVGLAPGNVYGPPGGRANYGFGGALTLLDPVGATTGRLLAGEKAAMLFCRHAEATAVAANTRLHLLDYRCTGAGDFAFTIGTTLPQVAVTVTFPYADLSAKAVTLVRDGVTRIRLEPGKPGESGRQVVRDPNALWSLIVTGLQDRDQVVVGDFNAAIAEKLPTGPPLTLEAAPIPAAQAAPFQLLTLPKNVPLNRNWRVESTFAGLPEGLCWMVGVPFLLDGRAVTDATERLFPLPPIAGPSRVYLLMALRRESNAAYFERLKDAAFPQLRLDDGSLCRPDDTRPALGWQAWPPIFSQRLVIQAFDVPPGRTVNGVRSVPDCPLLGLTALPEQPGTTALAAQVRDAQARGKAAWKTLQFADQLMTQMHAVAARLPAHQIAILTPYTGKDVLSRLFLGDLQETIRLLTPQQVIDPLQFQAQRIAAALYLEGENYVATARQPGDVADAIVRYVQEGGTLILLPTQPYPMFAAIGPKDQRKSPPLPPRFGLPLVNAIETTPEEALVVERTPEQNVLPDAPATFPFPDGDPRLRCVDRKSLPPGTTYTPIYRVRGPSGKEYGDAAALIELPAGANGKRGRILYIASILLRDPANGPLIAAATLRWLVRQTDLHKTDLHKTDLHQTDLHQTDSGSEPAPAP